MQLPPHVVDYIVVHELAHLKVPDHSPVFWTADSDVKPAGIPINIRPPFRFEAGHDSNQLPAGFRR
ncbi:M48 family peptidase [Sinorhizobium meliloti]|uniref:M48 metallopeptidase family protein n=1 Tax=Rhizobium meliloti TaxID=382 RepID=UPI000FD55B5B|nr:M48 family peptidase [Sinorhizobium meliloti]